MILILTKRAKNDLLYLPTTQKNKILSLIRQMKNANTANEIRHCSLHGWPHCKYIEIEEKRLAFQFINQQIEILGIVDQDQLYNLYM